MECKSRNDHSSLEVDVYVLTVNIPCAERAVLIVRVP
jgi:hypothetical protein